jgi:sugar phosphate isomerase/epimerase
VNDVALDRVSLDHMCVLGMPRVELVALAADLGCRYISTSVESNRHAEPGYPHYSLREPGARREMLAALRDRGVAIAMGEGLFVRPGEDVADAAGDLDVLAELGAPQVNVVSLDPDLDRTVDQFGALAELAAQRGMETATEPAPGLTVPDLPTAVRVRERVGRPDFRLVIDTMHVCRTGTTPADLAALPPGAVGYIQLCDVPRIPLIPDYVAECTSERLVPGDGELPLAELLAALPRDVVVGVEVPQRARARAGVGALERIRPAVEATRRLLSGVQDQPR